LYLLLPSVSLSRQIQHSLSTAAAVTAVVAVAVSMAVEAEAEASMVVADLMAVENFVVAASMAARGRLAEEVTTKAAGLKLAAISARPEIGRRTFVPQSTMASGIRSATPVVPHV
jgi:hypothetical protein